MRHSIDFLMDFPHSLTVEVIITDRFIILGNTSPYPLTSREISALFQAGFKQKGVYTLQEYSELIRKAKDVWPVDEIDYSKYPVLQEIAEYIFACRLAHIHHVDLQPTRLILGKNKSIVLSQVDYQILSESGFFTWMTTAELEQALIKAYYLFERRSNEIKADNNKS